MIYVILDICFVIVALCGVVFLDVWFDYHDSYVDIAPTWREEIRRISHTVRREKNYPSAEQI